MSLDIKQLQAQKQVLTQLMQQSILILQLNNTNLEEYVKYQLLINPLLESTGSFNDDQLNIGKWINESNIDRRDSFQGSNDNFEADIPFLDRNDIKSYLMDQLPYGELSKTEVKLLSFMISLLDDDTGFLTYSPQQIADLICCPLDQVTKCLELLRSLEPLGIASQNLEGCLIAQLKKKSGFDSNLEEIILHHLQGIAKGHYRAISQKLGLSLPAINHYIEMIKACNPRPMEGFSACAPICLVPDILFEKQDGVWTPIINDRWAGSVGISKLYKYYCDNAENKEIRAYLTEKIQTAQLLLTNIEMRRDTLLAISKIIIARQLDFLEGTNELMPLRMKDVADTLGLHASTISRAVKDKYIQIPRGTFPMRRFFALSPASKDGANFSTEAVKKSLFRFIEQEDKAHPLSDNKLAKLFEKEGLKISRRTIVKYRTEDNIPNSSQRKLY